MSHLVPTIDYSGSPDPIAAIHAARLERQRRMAAPMRFDDPEAERPARTEEVKPQPMRHLLRSGLPWTEDELETLLAMAHAGKPPNIIAKRLRRSCDAIRARAQKMGIVLGRRLPPPPLAAEAVVALYRLVYERPLPAASAGRVRAIIDLVAHEHGIAAEDILGEGRTLTIVRARQNAMWLAARDTPHSLAHIGRIFNRDHTTVIFAVRRENERCKANVRGLGVIRA
jgi:hypothetical protein